jgi:hypothetical protein
VSTEHIQALQVGLLGDLQQPSSATIAVVTPISTLMGGRRAAKIMC